MLGSTSTPGTNFPAADDGRCEIDQSARLLIRLRGRFTEPVGLTQLSYLPEVSENAHSFFNRGIFVETAGQETDDRVR
jgi:hypothetical protein